MKTAVQFGAGNIGRGFMGQLFYESGYQTVFVDVVPEAVRLLNVEKRYTIRIASETPIEIPILNVRAVDGRDIEAVSEEIARAEVACTAVGVNALSRIAPVLARGIARRFDLENSAPLNVIICENMSHADDFLRRKVEAELPEKHRSRLSEKVGFVMSVVARMVPVMTEEQKRQDPLLVSVEAYKRLPVDKAAFVGPIPEIVGMEPEENFQAYVDDKLFTHNCGHAVAAYIGYLRGHEYMYQVMKDDKVTAVVRKALSETGDALIKKYGFDREKHQAHIEDLLGRFGNIALGDQVVRVGGDPMRKLGPNDRLVGAARFALSQGIFPTNVCKGIAAGLRFDPPGDLSAARVQNLLRRGVDEALAEICSLNGSDWVSTAVKNEFARVASEFASEQR